MTSKQRLLIILSAVVVVIIVIVSLVLRPSVPTTGVKFIVVPDSVQVTSGNLSFTVNYESIISLSPGKYDLTMKRDEFKTVTQSVTVTDKTISLVYAYLEPLTANARSIVSSSDMQRRIERISGNSYSVGEKQIEQNYPFIKDLPINDVYFTINPCYFDAGDGKGNTLSICINLAITSDYYKSLALQALKDKGIDVTKWPIHYVDPTTSD